MLCNNCKAKTDQLPQTKNSNQFYCQNCAPESFVTKEAVAQTQICEECESIPGKFQCAECEQILCSDCEIKLHKKGARVHHFRKPLVNEEKKICSNLIIVFDLSTESLDNEINRAIKYLEAESKLPVSIYIHESLQEKHSKAGVLYFRDFDLLKIEKMVLHSIFVISYKLSPTVNDSLANIQKIEINLKIILNGVKFDGDNQKKKINLLEELTFFPNSVEKQIHTQEKTSLDEISTINGGYSTGLLQWQPLKEAEYDNVLTKNLSINIQNCMRRLAEEGELLIPMKTFENNLMNWFKIPKGEVDNIILRCERAKIINKTTRVFSKEHNVSYISMNLDFLTIQSLMWAVKSLYKDGMTTNEKLVISRIKEAFTIKMQQKQWDHLVSSLKLKANDPCIQNNNNLNSSDVSQNLIIDVVYDVNTSGYINLIKLKGWEQIPFEDTGEFNHAANESTWKAFVDFLDNYFLDTSNINNESTSNGSSVKLSTTESTLKDGSIADPFYQKSPTQANLSTIIENDGESSLQKKDKSQSSWGKSYQTDSQILPDGSDCEDIRSIPGGRYGCAYFVKSFGPPALRAMTIGKLSLYVQEALNIGFLRYQRTLILKNEFRKINNIDEEKKEFETLPEHEEQIKLLKTAIIEILIENPRGMPLAQIPHFIKRKLHSPVNFQEIGFAKLKNFLKSMSDRVKIEVSSSNNSYAILLENYQKYSINSTQQITNTPLSISTKPLQTAFSSQHASTPINTDVKPTILKRAIRSRKVSNLEEYLRQTLQLLHTILNKHQMGVEINLLYHEFCSELGYEFDYRVFGCDDFYNFLLNYMSPLIDIEIKKNKMNKISLIIYPKETKFKFGRTSTVTSTPNNLFQNNSMNDGERSNHQISFIETQQCNELKSASSFFEVDNSMVTKKSVQGADLNKILTAQVTQYQIASPTLERHPNTASKINFNENIKKGKSHKRFMSMWSGYDKVESGDECGSKQFMHESNYIDKDGKLNDEESNLTLKDHLKFIDFLLDENPNENQFNMSFKTNGLSEISSIAGHSPSLSVSNIRPIHTGITDFCPKTKVQSSLFPPTHNKAFSQDFHFNKFV